MRIEKYSFCPDAAMAVRITVFVEEQGFRDEFDEIDGISTHLLMLEDDGSPVATCRVFRRGESDTYVLGRLAVIKEYRGRGIGEQMIKAAEAHVKAVGGRLLTLHSQCRAQKFYEKCGFLAHGEIECEEDCPHVWMTKAVTPITHTMKLAPAPFELISQGKKTIELRLYDEKRQLIFARDTIRFSLSTDESVTLDCLVVAMHLFSSFEELYKVLPLDRCGYTEQDIHTAHPSDMERYYSAHEQEKFGVVGIEIKLI